MTEHSRMIFCKDGRDNERQLAELDLVEKFALNPSPYPPAWDWSQGWRGCALNVEEALGRHLNESDFAVNVSRKVNCWSSPQGDSTDKTTVQTGQAPSRQHCALKNVFLSYHGLECIGLRLPQSTFLEANGGF